MQRPVRARRVERGGVDRGELGLDPVRAALRCRRRSRIRNASVIASVSHRAAVLVLERDELAVDDARRPPGVLDQHQREQSPRLARLGHQLDEQPAEADRLAREVVVGRRRVALGEHEVDHREDAVEPLGERLGAAARGRGCAASAILRFARSSR